MDRGIEKKGQNLINVGFLARGTDLPITNREREVLSQLALGKTNKEISETLMLSPSTVRNHISNIFTKLKISNRSQATAVAIFSGLLKFDKEGLKEEHDIKTA